MVEETSKIIKAEQEKAEMKVSQAVASERSKAEEEQNSLKRSVAARVDENR